jgi:hypothetical protein
VYEGKQLSEWVVEVAALDRIDTIVNGDSPSVRALQAIGTNAIPWLLSEMKKPPPLLWQLNRILGKQRVIKYRFAVPAGAGNLHQIRARCGFWALGERAQPAIPDLVNIMQQQSEFASSALAGIGSPALEAMHHCLTNVPAQSQASNTQTRIVGDTMASLYVALNTRRVVKSDAEFLLPTVRGWMNKTNSAAAFWAGAVLGEHESQK